MAQIVEDVEKKVVEEVKVQPQVRAKHFVRVGESLANILKWDTAGEELIFEHEKGVFLMLSDSDRAKLSHDNKVRYSMSLQLNAKHDPENDAIQNRLKVIGSNERRKQFEATVKTTSQSARASKKLQAFVGEGYEERWSRPDKIEERLAMGYEIVKPDEDVYAGVVKTEGHYETRVQPGQTELVLMRVRKERKAEIMKEKDEAAQRLLQASDKSGASELRNMGAALIPEGSGSNWQDRT